MIEKALKRVSDSPIHKAIERYKKNALDKSTDG